MALLIKAEEIKGLVSIGEAIDEQKIEHLVLPGSRRRGELSLEQLGEIEVQQTFLDPLSHGSGVLRLNFGLFQ